MPHATYVYCVVKSARKPPVSRVPAGLPRAGAARTIKGPWQTWLIVADVPLDAYSASAIDPQLNDLDWVAERAVRHELVVEHFARRFDVVPMKLFTMFHSDARARADLDRRTDLRAILKKIGGCAEWTARLTRVPASAGAAGPDARARTPRAARTGTGFLLRKKSDRDRSRARSAALRRVAAATYRALSGAARDGVRKEAAVGGTNLLLDATFLVARSRQKRFLAAAKIAARAAERAGCALSVSGPWPAYHFVTTA
jgi:hypothetical protein